MGGPIEEIRPGDVIWFAPGEKHWHGATATTAMTHIAVQERLDGKAWTGWNRSATNNTGTDVESPAMHPSRDGRTRFVPKPQPHSIVERTTTGFPPDLLNRLAARLQILTWLYAFTFFMAAFFPRLLIPAQRLILFEHPANWAPGALAIAVAVMVALAIRFGQWRPGAITVLALVFEIVSSYGIAAAEFLQPRGLAVGPSFIGLSWCRCGCCSSMWSFRPYPATR
jgi:hypothetical protein